VARARRKLLRMDEPERRIRALAAAAGYRTDLALGRAAGVDRGTLRLILRGRRPRPATIHGLARAFEVTFDVIERALEVPR
jgi:transcriptional regulator with XRE-family HTH domain